MPSTNQTQKMTKREARNLQSEKVSMDEFQKVKMMRGVDHAKQLPIIESETIQDETMSQYFQELERQESHFQSTEARRVKQQRKSALQDEVYGRDKTLMMQLIESTEYEQLELYILNNKHKKAARLIDTMLEALRMTRGKYSQFNTMPYIWLMRKSYSSQIKVIRIMHSELAEKNQEFKDKHRSIKITDPEYVQYTQQKIEHEEQQEHFQGYINSKVRDAELILWNIEEAICAECRNPVNSFFFSPEERLLSRADLLLHFVNFYQLEVSTGRMTSLAAELVQSKDMQAASGEVRAKVNLIAALAKFATERVPYVEIKGQLKKALLMAESRQLKSTIAHNLAVINYCEVQDHNDRASQDGLSQYMSSQAADEAVQQDMAQRAKEKKEESRIRAELALQERNSELKKRRLMVRQRVASSFRDLGNAQFVKKGNKAANAKYADLARKIAKRELLRNSSYRALLQDGEQKHEKSSSGPMGISDILKDGILQENKPIRDIIRHFSDTKDLSMNILAQIPLKTRESYIETLALNRLPGLTESEEFLKGALNEVLPLLFVSLKLSLDDFSQEKPKKLLLIQNLDDFMIHDRPQQLLINKDLVKTENSRLYFLNIYKQLELITRLYTLDSKKYKDQSRYWSTYAYRVALALAPEETRRAHKQVDIFGKMDFLGAIAESDDYPYIEEEERKEIEHMINFQNKTLGDDSDLSNIKRLDGLRLAIMIDNGKLKEAKDVLEMFNNGDEFAESEKDIKLLVQSLLGILKKNFGTSEEEKREGTRLMERARVLGDEIKVLYERLKWLQLSPEALGLDNIGLTRPVMARVFEEISQEYYEERDPSE